jgi:hypothetical protein
LDADAVSGLRRDFVFGAYVHLIMGFQHETPCSKLRWFYQYFGVRGNYKVLEVVYEYAAKAWKRWLGERHRDGRISHEKFKRVHKTLPLPLPRIVHPNVAKAGGLQKVHHWFIPRKVLQCGIASTPMRVFQPFVIFFLCNIGDNNPKR